MTGTREVDHLENIRSDIRGEIKQRIEQRDRYSIQLTISLAAIVGLAFSETGFDRVLIAAPLVSIYFSVLILYSYRVHRVLAGFLREYLEPELARLCGTDAEIEWEGYYGRHAVPGIRSGFFIRTLWAVTVSTMVYLFSTQHEDLSFRVVLSVAGLIYVVACGWITAKLGR